MTVLTQASQPIVYAQNGMLNGQPQISTAQLAATPE